MQKSCEEIGLPRVRGGNSVLFASVHQTILYGIMD